MDFIRGGEILGDYLKAALEESDLRVKRYMLQEAIRIQRPIEESLAITPNFALISCNMTEYKPCA